MKSLIDVLRRDRRLPREGYKALLEGFIASESGAQRPREGAAGKLGSGVSGAMGNGSPDLRGGAAGEQGSGSSASWEWGSSGSELLNYACANAAEVAVQNFARTVYIRGLLEISNHCRNLCRYCGLRAANRTLTRYRMSLQEILDSCRSAYSLGFRTFVLQGGEDPHQDDAFIETVVRALRCEFPDAAITLSVGERSDQAYRRFRSAGADRYLLRHETADRAHYYKLHPDSMSYEGRLHCLRTLKSLGYQTGTGMMVGSPGQTTDNLADDIMLIGELAPQMIGIGPFIPQTDTPFASSPAGSARLTFLLIAIFRMMFPKALIPSTTALASLSPDNRLGGILAGANVLMPNITPVRYRKDYAIYDGKACLGAESAEGLDALAAELGTIGYHMSFGRGDYIP